MMADFNENGRPSMAISITCTVFSFFNGNLEVLLCRDSGNHDDNWRLPSSWLMKREHLDDGARRLAKELTGIDNTYIEQVTAFGNTNGINFSQTMTIGYFSLVDRECFLLTSSMFSYGAQWFKISDMPELLLDKEILEYHIKYLRDAAREKPIAFDLLPQSFSLPQLAKIYEVLLDVKLEISNFRNKILKLKILDELDQKRKSFSNRETMQYSFNAAAYEKMRSNGFILDKCHTFLYRKMSSGEF